MKILHTADWHLGHRLHEQSQQEEQQLFLNWLSSLIISDEYDVLLISGDVFDTGTPSNQSLSMYYNFLIGLNNTCCKHIVITGGNHDSPGTLNAPKEILNALSIYVVGKAVDPVSEEVFNIKINDEEIFVAAVPYLRDQDVRKAIAGESFDDINERYKAALISHYNAVSNYIEQINKNKSVVIAMGHLFAIGGSISDSEKDISVGNLGHIGAGDFPENFDYVALGHLHKPQIVGGNQYIRYSGSPVVLSFSEIGYDKKLIGIEVENKQIKEITDIVIPAFRNVLQIKGDLQSCIHQLQEVDTKQVLQPWLEVVLDNDSSTLDINDIKKAAEELNISVLKVTLKNTRETVGLDELLENVKQIKTLKPNDVFRKKCEEQGIDLNENSDLLDAFNEALIITQEQS